jgi:hypothetical protein
MRNVVSVAEGSQPPQTFNVFERVESSLAMGAEREKEVDRKPRRETFVVRNRMVVVDKDVKKFWQASLDRSCPHCAENPRPRTPGFDFCRDVKSFN